MGMAKPIAKLVAMLTPKRTWFQFRLRTLFVLVAVASFPCAWLASMLHMKYRERNVVAHILRVGGHVQYAWEKDIGRGSGHVSEAIRGEPPGPQWIRKLLGDDFVTTVSRVTFRQKGINDSALADLDLEGLPQLSGLALNGPLITDRSLARLQGITKLQSLDLSGTQVTDVGLMHLRPLKRLEFLALNETQVTDAGLAQLGTLMSLQHIELTATRLTGSGLGHLCSLPCLETLRLERTLTTDGEMANVQLLTRLRELDLSCTVVSDAGLFCLRELSDLRRLNLRLTLVSDSGVAELRAALPRCKVVGYGKNFVGG